MIVGISHTYETKITDLIISLKNKVLVDKISLIVPFFIEGDGVFVYTSVLKVSNLTLILTFFRWDFGVVVTKWHMFSILL